MPYGLSDTEIEKLKAVFALHPCIDKAVLYGSRAKGNYKPGSDIDLALYGGLHLTELNTTAMEIDDLLLPYKTDVSIAEQIDNAALLQHINRVGKLFYEKSNY